MLQLGPNRSNSVSGETAGQGCHLEDGKCRLSNRARCHGDCVLGQVALMDGDYLEGGGRDVEVCEAGVLQVVKVSLRQRVPVPDNTTKSEQEDTSFRGK